MPPDSGLRAVFPNYPRHWRTEESVDAVAEELLAGIDKSSWSGIANPRLVSSYAGRIEEILFTFPDYAATDNNLSPAYRSVIATLPVGTRFTVVHADSYGPVFCTWFRDAGHPDANVTLVPVDDTLNITDWAEDPYVALHDPTSGARCLMEPYEFLRSGDALIAEAVQRYTDIAADQAPLIFQGGNCLIGDDFWLMGRDYMEDTLALHRQESGPVNRPPDLTPDEFARRQFRDRLDAERKLYVVGLKNKLEMTHWLSHGVRHEGVYLIDVPYKGIGTYQPIFHIDMFVTLVGRNKSDKFTVMVASPKLSEDTLNSASPYALDWAYDELADQLDAWGFHVVRNPLVHWPTPGETKSLREFKHLVHSGDGAVFENGIAELVALGARDHDPVTPLMWHHVTWNNCLVENNGPGRQRVYIPTFGHGDNAQFAPLDDKMEQLWRDEGFDVIRLGDFNKFAMRQGVVHCITKYLSRSAPQS